MASKVYLPPELIKDRSMMYSVSPSHSMDVRVLVPFISSAVADVAAVIGEVGGGIHGVDVSEPHGETTVLQLRIDARNDAHQEEILEALQSMPGVDIIQVEDVTFELHKRGKIAVSLDADLISKRDLARAYTPGVARVCNAIAKEPELAKRYTIKANSVAVVSDGTAVLGLGNIGPLGALPVMEGKAALFKQFANVDAWPVCLDTTDTEEIIRTVKAIAPVYGGINLEDISAPRCFEIEERLKQELDIPVFHDDQHGTAVVTLAALLSAVRLVGKELADLKVVISGVGAAGTAIIKLLMYAGVQHVIGFGRAGALGPGQTHESPFRQWLADNTNEEGFTGTLKEGLVGADVFIGVSQGDILTGDDIALMNEGAIVFAMANPQPEVNPREAMKHAAVVATGRSDYPNQINNVLVFPGLFRGLLDAGASRITMAMLHAAAEAIAGVVSDAELAPDYIIPGVFDSRIAPLVAAAVQQVVREEESLTI